MGDPPREAGPSGVPIIESALTGGDPRSLRNVDFVVDLVLRSPERVDELFDCVFSRDEIVRMRAGDALEKVCARRPELLQGRVERVLNEMAAVRQPSVQWHLAQIVGHLSLDDGQRTRAVQILSGNLAAFDDRIVTNLTLATLAGFARQDPALRPGLVTLLRRHEHSRHRSVAARVRKLLGEFAAPAP